VSYSIGENKTKEAIDIEKNVERWTTEVGA
jgi:hypothetical protein